MILPWQNLPWSSAQCWGFTGKLMDKVLIFECYWCLVSRVSSQELGQSGKVRHWLCIRITLTRYYETGGQMGRRSVGLNPFVHDIVRMRWAAKGDNLSALMFIRLCVGANRLLFDGRRVMAVRYFPLLSLSYFSLLLRNFRFCCGKFGSQSWLGSYRIALKFNFEVFRINESVGDKYSVRVSKKILACGNFPFYLRHSETFIGSLCVPGF